MKEFDYIIIGGGCAGLSLAYELETHNKLKDKNLAIIEPRDEYKRDKTWSFWKVFPHNYEDCVKKSWDNFSINIPNKTKFLECNKLPYQSIDSGLFYKKINSILKQNLNIKFYKNTNEVGLNNSLVFNSVPSIESNENQLWQHFKGIEIETTKDVFDEKIMNLMDFDCQQYESVHFFYTLPFSKNKAMVETTWLSKMNNDLEKDYDEQLKNWFKNRIESNGYGKLNSASDFDSDLSINFESYIPWPIVTGIILDAWQRNNGMLGLISLKSINQKNIQISIKSRREIA